VKWQQHMRGGPAAAVVADVGINATAATAYGRWQWALLLHTRRVCVCVYVCVINATVYRIWQWVLLLHTRRKCVRVCVCVCACELVFAHGHMFLRANSLGYASGNFRGFENLRFSLAPIFFCSGRPQLFSPKVKKCAGKGKFCLGCLGSSHSNVNYAHARQAQTRMRASMRAWTCTTGSVTHTCHAKCHAHARTNLNTIYISMSKHARTHTHIHT